MQMRNRARGARDAGACLRGALLALLLTSPCALAQSPLAEALKRTAADGSAGARFGDRSDLEGDTLVIGASEDSGAGAAYVFYRNQGGQDSWGQVKKLTASDLAAGDRFGIDVAISGDTIVVGAWLDDNGGGTDAGAAYVFYRNQGGADNWGEVKKLGAGIAAANYRYGQGVDIEGDTIVIGARGSDTVAPQAGAVHVHYRDQGGPDNWGHVVERAGSDIAGQDWFGMAAELSGDTLVVSARRNDALGANAGAAYVFERNQGGADNWGQTKKLTATDGAAGDLFGWGSSITGDTIVIGAPGADAAGADAGALYVFERNQGGAGNWGQVKKLIASDAAAGDELAWEVVVRSDVIIAGAHRKDGAGADSGAVYLFSRNEGGAENWGELTKLTASDAAAGDQFGISMCGTLGDVVVVGARFDDDLGADSGSVYVFGEPDGDGDGVPDEIETALGGGGMDVSLPVGATLEAELLPSGEIEVSVEDTTFNQRLEVQLPAGAAALPGQTVEVVATPSATTPRLGMRNVSLPPGGAMRMDVRAPLPGGAPLRARTLIPAGAEPDTPGAEVAVEMETASRTMRVDGARNPLATAPGSDLQLELDEDSGSEQSLAHLPSGARRPNPTSPMQMQGTRNASNDRVTRLRNVDVPAAATGNARLEAINQGRGAETTLPPGTALEASGEIELAVRTGGSSRGASHVTGAIVSTPHSVTVPIDPTDVYVLVLNQRSGTIGDIPDGRAPTALEAQLTYYMPVGAGATEDRNLQGDVTGITITRVGPELIRIDGLIGSSAGVVDEPDAPSPAMPATSSAGALALGALLIASAILVGAWRRG